MITEARPVQAAVDPARRLRGRIRAAGPAGERSRLVLLLGLTVALGLGMTFIHTQPVPLAAEVLPVVLGGPLLGLRALRMLLVAVGISMLVSVADLGFTATRSGSIVVVALTAAIVYQTIARRERLGVVGAHSDTMLAELRDRLAPPWGIPLLPKGWQAETAIRAAGGLSFGGDFLVVALEGSRLEMALVDVSGKGLEAATRALQLSGALGGLLGSVPPVDFLPQANRYLLRQEWEEGFATAVHVSLNLVTGDYLVHAAGHPPAALFVAGSGEWSLLEASGPALGLVPAATFRAVGGQLRSDGALLLYTDGMVEVSGRDVDVGIDRLLGEANRLVVDGFAGGGERLLYGVTHLDTDDRAVVLLWRS